MATAADAVGFRKGNSASEVSRAKGHGEVEDEWLFYSLGPIFISYPDLSHCENLHRLMSPVLGPTYKDHPPIKTK